MGGTPMRNTEPHQKCSSNAPPTSGPMVMPPMKQLNQMPMAAPRCRSSLNILVMSARIDGEMVAPAMPSRARAAMSSVALLENAASTEATAKAEPPTSSSLRRPMRSPSVPMVIIRPASMKP